jgi:hypothetical protein
MPSRPFSPYRRLFLQNAALAGGAALTSGCVRHIPTSALPAPDPGVPLTIDVHCHIFNGTDLQVRDFLAEIVDADGEHPFVTDLAGVLQEFNWKKAPTGLIEVKELKADLFEPGRAHQKMAAVHTDSDLKFRKQFQAAEATAEKKGKPAGAAMPPTYDELHRGAGSSPQSGRTTAPAARQKGGSVELLAEYFQYRYVALNDYLELYNGRSGRSMDLLIAHMVDYDWPLANGNPTLTRLHDQVSIMRRITLLSKGRVHAFAPFDPIREVVHRRNPNDTWGSLDFVKHSVMQSGCLGVKLYPPMGFAPFGNARVDPATWHGVWGWLGDETKVASTKDSQLLGFGERLDEVLRDLYEWCIAEDIPVMAHTNVSNGRSAEFDQLTGARHWKDLQENFGTLRLNFGHLGGFPDGLSPRCDAVVLAPGTNANAETLIELMSRDTAAKGGKFFGDASFESRLLACPEKLREIYRAALLAPSSDPRSILRDRLMYGTDWSLLIQEPNMARYLDDFVTLFNAIDSAAASAGGASAPAPSASFFGLNAVNYLGLAKGSRTRKRIDDLYGTEIPTPVWMQKVDSLRA